ncbi:unnamed protein product [Pedinophyceae sp. YPF-701]|nr:unnamed protein product [Pedinophyceae sp. YPF-701]
MSAVTGPARVFVLRHGRSKANEAGLIVSRFENGVKPEYGLAPLGERQAAAAGVSLRAQLDEAGLSDREVKFLASPFRRTLQTAQICAENAGVPVDAIQEEPLLRERGFGKYELTSHDAYEIVWEIDQRDPTQPVEGEGGESVMDVAGRVSQVLDRVKAAYDGKVVVLVSHGDVCQITCSVARNTKPEEHRSDHAIETGELRQIMP